MKLKKLVLLIFIIHGVTKSEQVTYHREHSKYSGILKKILGQKEFAKMSVWFCSIIEKGKFPNKDNNNIITRLPNSETQSFIQYLFELSKYAKKYVLNATLSILATLFCILTF